MRGTCGLSQFVRPPLGFGAGRGAVRNSWPRVHPRNTPLALPCSSADVHSLVVAARVPQGAAVCSRETQVKELAQGDGGSTGLGTRPRNLRPVLCDAPLCPGGREQVRLAKSRDRPHE